MQRGMTAELHYLNGLSTASDAFVGPSCDWSRTWCPRKCLDTIVPVFRRQDHLRSRLQENATNRSGQAAQTDFMEMTRHALFAGGWLYARRSCPSTLAPLHEVNRASDIGTSTSKLERRSRATTSSFAQRRRGPSRKAYASANAARRSSWPLSTHTLRPAGIGNVPMMTNTTPLTCGMAALAWSRASALSSGDGSGAGSEWVCQRPTQCSPRSNIACRSMVAAAVSNRTRARVAKVGISSVEASTKTRVEARSRVKSCPTDSLLQL